MNLAGRSGIGFLGIIYLGVGMRTFGYPSRRQTIVKDGAGAASRIYGTPSERERLGAGRLLTHDVGKEGRGSGRRGGDGGHFGAISVERGLDGI